MYFEENCRSHIIKKLFEESFIELSDEKKEKLLHDDCNDSNNEIQHVNVLNLRSKHSPYKVLWALTPKCNMKCLYCWPDVASIRKEYLGLECRDLEIIAHQLVRSKVCKVIISGGEALLCKNVWDIIKILRDGGCTVMMISNGTTINADVLDKVKSNNVALGISFDSSKDEINSITRRANVVDKVSASISAIIANGIPMAALITVTRHNFDYIKEHVQYLDSLGVNVIVLQDLKPFGSKEDYNSARLTVHQEQSIKELMEYLSLTYPHIRFDPTELMYFCGHKRNETGTIMTCDAGETGGYIDFYGNFMPCSFLSNLTYGNLLKNDLIDLWMNSDAANKLHEFRKVKVESLHRCKNCSAIKFCDGGCRADAFIGSGDFFGPASRCPKEMEHCRN